MSTAHGLTPASPRSTDVVRPRTASSPMGAVGPVGGVGVVYAQHLGLVGRTL